MIENMDESSIIDGAVNFIDYVRSMGIKTAIGSSSKNAQIILRKTKITELFDAVADGNDIINSKPDPDVFIAAMKKLNLNPCECLFAEDAKAGVETGIRAGMDGCNGCRDAKNSEKAIYCFPSLKEAYDFLCIK